MQSAAVKTDLFRFQLTTDQPAYDFGEIATMTATLLNDRATARTFTLQPLSGLSAAPQVVVVGPHSTASRTFTTTVDRTRQVRMAAVENGSTVSELFTTLRLKLPTLGLSGTPDETVGRCSRQRNLHGDGQQRARRHDHGGLGGAPGRRPADLDVDAVGRNRGQQPGADWRFRCPLRRPTTSSR